MIAIRELNKDTSTYKDWCAALTEFVSKKGTCDIAEGECFTEIAASPWESWYNEGKTVEEAFIIDGGYEKQPELLKKILAEPLDGKRFVSAKG